MELGMVGLGRMGANIVRRLMRDGHDCVVYDVNPEAIASWRARAPSGAASLRGPRLEAGRAPRRLGDGPGGRDHRADRRTRSPTSSRAATRSSTAATPTTATTCAARPRWPSSGIDYIDCGTSGGVFGLDRGYCLMIGGPDAAVERLDPIFATRRAGGRLRRAHPGPQRRARPGRERLPALRAERRRPLREDGPQRHRVRDHGRLRRGPEHPRATPTPARRSARPTPRPRRSSSPSTTSTTSTSPRSPRSGGGAA